MRGLTGAKACVSALAAAAFVMSSALAAGETKSPEPQPQKIEEPAPAMSVAALDLPTAPNDGGPDAAVYPAPAPSDADMSDTTIIGAASFYDDPGETASGEQYDPTAFTAAAQLKIRHKFGGIKFGRLYQPSYGLAEYEGKKLIVKFNDVGPLRPGRMFDLSRAAMKYFDDSLDKGVLPDVKVTVLPAGRAYAAGPVTDEQLAILGLIDLGLRLARIDPSVPTSNTWQVAAAPSAASADTAAAPAGMIDACIESSRACEDTGVAAAPSDHGPIDGFVQEGTLACADVSATGPNVHFELAGLLAQDARQESNDRAAAMVEDPAAE
ncbi:MAG TPA: septal ring lytic transglycosylase RlpA family protein [Xanthobacteraceae bacterium]|jgi:rare lipoprotein A|nr:septal ring lytic transglycosylase RlpA family protein [Xanthobacteraceae bacterium]